MLGMRWIFSSIAIWGDGTIVPMVRDGLKFTSEQGLKEVLAGLVYEAKGTRLSAETRASGLAALVAQVSLSGTTTDIHELKEWLLRIQAGATVWIERIQDWAALPDTEVEIKEALLSPMNGRYCLPDTIPPEKKEETNNGL